MIKFIYDIYIINNLKINLLIKMNILKSKKMIIDFFNEKIIFTKYKNIIILI